jgi:glycosyltransferase involved in cell wall biosynthesis
MPHFVLDARTASPHFPGIGRYVVNLAHALTPLLRPDERLSVLEDPAHRIALDPHVERVPVSDSPFGAAQQTSVPRLIKSLDADLYHSAYLLMPYRPGVPTVLTVYDLIPLLLPAQSSARATLFFRSAMRLALRAAHQVIVISESTRADLLSHFSISPNRVTAIPLAADPVFRPQREAVIAEVGRRYNLPPGYVLYVGSNKPHKNLTGLLDAWAQIAASPDVAGRSLVVAGAWDDQYDHVLERAGSAPVRWLGPVLEADLSALYSGAELFVFPSLYEGFGLPVLEAMACGAPVVCSDGSSLPEVAGNAARRVDTRHPAALAEAMRLVLADAALREELRVKGLAQAARFSWQKTAQRTLEVYRTIS